MEIWLVRMDIDIRFAIMYTSIWLEQLVLLPPLVECAPSKPIFPSFVAGMSQTVKQSSMARANATDSFYNLMQ